MNEEKRLKNIEDKLDTILQQLKIIQEKCDKMSSHIDFVDGVYERVKNPFNFILNKVDSYYLMDS